jgi:hypothetical protein
VAYLEGFKLTAGSLPTTREAICLASLAALAVATKNQVRAARLLGAVATYIVVPDPHDDLAGRVHISRFVQALRAQLDPVKNLEAWAEGRAMSWEQAINFGLEMPGNLP